MVLMEMFGDLRVLGSTFYIISVFSESFRNRFSCLTYTDTIVEHTYCGIYDIFGLACATIIQFDFYSSFFVFYGVCCKNCIACNFFPQDTVVLGFAILSSFEIPFLTLKFLIVLGHWYATIRIDFCALVIVLQQVKMFFQY